MFRGVVILVPKLCIISIYQGESVVLQLSNANSYIQILSYEQVHAK